jgi:hypothetical protein
MLRREFTLSIVAGLMLAGCGPADLSVSGC